MPKVKPAHIVVAIAVGLTAIFALPQILADQPGARSVSGSVVSETIGVNDTNATVDYTVRLLEGSDAQHESDHIFDSLAGLPGVGKAHLDTGSLQLTIEYDDSVIAPEPIRARLVDAGYLVPTVADATAMELAEDGSLQRIAVADDHGFDPSFMLAKAGVPIEIEFAPGQECRVQVKFPELGVEQDISQGGTVALPALEPGSYTIACSGDAQEGTIIVE